MAVPMTYELLHPFLLANLFSLRLGAFDHVCSHLSGTTRPGRYSLFCFLLLSAVGRSSSGASFIGHGMTVTAW